MEGNCVGVKCSMRGKVEQRIQKKRKEIDRLGKLGIIWNVILQGKEMTRIYRRNNF
jgi:hypothetical protein